MFVSIGAIVCATFCKYKKNLFYYTDYFKKRDELLPLWRKEIQQRNPLSSKNTIFTISENTGYSASTVSRVLSGQAEKYRISQTAVEIITKEARRCNYRPNMVAQSLRTQRSMTIGLLLPEIDNPFFATLSGIIIGLLEARGYHTLLSDSRENSKEEMNALRMFQGRNVDGIICVPVAESPAFHEEVGQQIPMVLIDRYFKETTLPYVCTDNYQGAYLATEFLLKRGYQRILAIQGVPQSMPNKERVRGFEAALNGSGANGLVVGNAFSTENGFQQTIKAFEGADKPYDAIFAFSSTILLGVISALRKLQLKPAADIGVISFDNNGFLDFLDPAVTRIEQPLRESGEIAVDTLFSIMAARRQGRPEPEPLHMLIPPTLVVRESC